VSVQALPVMMTSTEPRPSSGPLFSQGRSAPTSSSADKAPAGRSLVRWTHGPLPTSASHHDYMQYIDWPCQDIELYLNGLEKLYSRHHAPNVDGTCMAAVEAVRERVREVLDDLGLATPDWARADLTSAPSASAAGGSQQVPRRPPPRDALLRPLMYGDAFLGGTLPDLERLVDRAACTSKAAARSVSLKAAKLQAKWAAQRELEEAMCPPWTAYPCIELRSEKHTWPEGITPCKRITYRTRQKKKNSNNTYYVCVRLARQQQRRTAVYEMAHRLVCWAAHGPPPPTSEEQRDRNYGVVMHLCNNPRCLSAGHLKYGTKATNHWRNTMTT